MSTWVSFVNLGLHHILNPAATDHILFLLALVAGYRLADWRHLVAVTTAFTVGHSATLALAAMGLLRLPETWVEFLIPVTIVLTALANMVRLGRKPTGTASLVAAGVFGLIHGAGFANYLTQMFAGEVLVPLFGFNVGIELGQICLLGVGIAGLTIIDRLLRTAGGMPIRVAGASVVAGGWAAMIAVNRWPA